MYVRDGKQMPEREEGAAFFQPIGSDGRDFRVLGLQPGLLTNGFATNGFGDDPAPAPAPVTTTYEPFRSPIWRALSIAGAALGAFHGYKRNDSIGWALGWALLGSLAPIIVIPIAFAQGFAKQKR